MLGKGELPPYEPTWRNDFEKDWIKGCQGDPNDPMEKFAYYLTFSRDEDTLMVPLYEMANHSNDPDKLNTLSYKPEKVGKPFRFIASKTINPGDQIYNSYNRCNPCSDVDYKACETFSRQRTPELFTYFGFVEDLPQNWEFDAGPEDSSDDEDTAIEFCLEKNDSGELDVYWFADKAPNDFDVEWLLEEIQRLKDLRANKDKLVKTLVQSDDDKAEEEETEGGGKGQRPNQKMTRFEWDSIWTYHEALVRAMNAAVVAAVVDEDDEQGDEL